MNEDTIATSDGGPSGISGVLAFFLITLGILGPLWIVADTLYALGRPDFLAMRTFFPMLTIFIFSVSAVSLGLRLFAAWRFMKVRNWMTVQIGIAVLWLLAILNLLVAPLVISSTMGVPFTLLLQAMGPGALLWSAAYPVVWTAYLLMSKRVRNTYAGSAPAA